MVDTERLKLFIINELLETSNSDDEIEDMCNKRRKAKR